MNTKLLSNRKTWFFFAALLALDGYFLGLRPQLGLQTSAQIEMILLGGLLLILLGALLFLLVSLLGLFFVRNRAGWRKRLRGQLIFALITVVVFVTIVAASQWLAYTPPILDEDGKPQQGSIASLEKVRLGGVDQWLIIRGHDINKPVLLFLSGGPGSSEAGRVMRFNAELEKHFVVVIWEQRGCAKSYPSLNPKSELTVDQYASEIIELTDMLRERFDEEKIYLVGHSWGTIIGVRAVQARSDLFHAYVGTAQMVDVLETDQIIYQMMLDHSRETGDTQFVQTLDKQGEPPYSGKSPIQPYATLFGREYMVFEGPNIKNEEFRREGDLTQLLIKQPEYGWLDRLYFLLSLKDTFNVVYPQLQEFDFRLDAATLDLPVYLILGRYDTNGTYWLAEEYFNILQSPHKRLYIFEESGHGMIWEENEKYHDIMINTVLPETYQPLFSSIDRQAGLRSSLWAQHTKEYTMKKLFLISFLALAGFSLTAFLFFAIRQAQANREIEAEWDAPLPDAPVLAATSRLEIIPLYEEASKSDEYISGHGVSYLIRTDAATILLDIGNNPDQLEVAPFAQNMQKLGIDWNEIDRIVISHPHPDHIGGVEAWKQNTITFGELPGGIGERLVFIPSKMDNKGAIHATVPTLPSPDVGTTGVISYPEVYPLSLFKPKGNEQALVVNVAGEGLVLITGCGHPTLEKLVERAETLYSLPVVGVVGGLHYEDATTEDVQPHIQFLEPRQLKLVALSPHDSSPQALEAFQSAFPEAYQVIQVGGRIQFP